MHAPQLAAGPSRWLSVCAGTPLSGVIPWPWRSRGEAGKGKPLSLSSLHPSSQQDLAQPGAFSVNTGNLGCTRLPLCYKLPDVGVTAVFCQHACGDVCGVCRCVVGIGRLGQCSRVSGVLYHLSPFYTSSLADQERPSPN